MLLGKEKDSDPACAVLCLEATDSAWCIGVAATEEIPSVDGAVGPLKGEQAETAGVANLFECESYFVVLESYEGQPICYTLQK